MRNSHSDCETISPCGRRVETKFSLDVTTHPGQWGQVAGAKAGAEICRGEARELISENLRND